MKFIIVILVLFAVFMLSIAAVNFWPPVFSWPAIALMFAAAFWLVETIF